MITICIPVYNYNVTELVTRLSDQARKLNILTEIIIIDDCSEDNFREQNENIGKGENLIRLYRRVGRAAVRNLFLKYASYDNLLFLDCDSVVVNNDFLDKYAEAVKNHPGTVICGGREYESCAPEIERRLRWKYGVRRESRSVSIRNSEPYRSFMSNNFLISRKIFETVNFNERLMEYGYEDTLFAFQLMKKGISILHIENIIINGHLETNFRYLEKTEEAICNLVNILKLTDFDKDLIKEIRLLRFYFKYLTYRNIWRLIFLPLKPAIKLLLGKGFSNLILFDCYRLGLLSVKMHGTELSEYK